MTHLISSFAKTCTNFIISTPGSLISFALEQIPVGLAFKAGEYLRETAHNIFRDSEEANSSIQRSVFFAGCAGVASYVAPFLLDTMGFKPVEYITKESVGVLAGAAMCGLVPSQGMQKTCVATLIAQRALSSDPGGFQGYAQTLLPYVSLFGSYYTPSKKDSKLSNNRMVVSLLLSSAIMIGTRPADSLLDLVARIYPVGGAALILGAKSLSHLKEGDIVRAAGYGLASIVAVSTMHIYLENEAMKLASQTSSQDFPDLPSDNPPLSCPLTAAFPGSDPLTSDFLRNPFVPFE